MSNEYQGLAKVALQYWQAYIKGFLGLGTALIILGSAAATIVLLFLPEAKWYLALAWLSYIMHSTALFVKDVWRDEFEIGQTTYSSHAHLIAIIIVMGAMESMLLLMATAGAYAIQAYTAYPLLAAGFAMYFAVADLLAQRRGIRSPGWAVGYSVAWLIVAVVDIHRAVLSEVPIIGSRRRPQS